MSDRMYQRPAHVAQPDDQPPMPVDEARRVIWQTHPKAPMGQLLKEGKLTRKDLEWAISKAYRPEVRRAALCLLQELDQAVAPAQRSFQQAEAHVVQPRHGARVVLGSGFLMARQEHHLARLGVVVGVTVMVFLYSLIDAARSMLAGRPVNVLASVGFVLSMALGAWYVRRHARAWRSYWMGYKGEEQVVEQLRTALDHRWTIYRNLQLPQRKDDLDLVLVGPGGVWTVQVKALSTPLRCSNGGWEYRRGRRWVRCDPKHDPGVQVTRQATALHDYLARNGIDRFVERAIALAESVGAADVAASAIPVWLPFNIAERARALATRHQPTHGELARINDLLERRASEQRAVERAKEHR
jgi:Nuclease-related domain